MPEELGGYPAHMGMVAQAPHHIQVITMIILNRLFGEILDFFALVFGFLRDFFGFL